MHVVFAWNARPSQELNLQFVGHLVDVASREKQVGKAPVRKVVVAPDWRVAAIKKRNAKVRQPARAAITAVEEIDGLNVGLPGKRDFKHMRSWHACPGAEKLVVRISVGVVGWSNQPVDGVLRSEGIEVELVGGACGSGRTVRSSGIVDRCGTELIPCRKQEEDEGLVHTCHCAAIPNLGSKYFYFTRTSRT